MKTYIDVKIVLITLALSIFLVWAINRLPALSALGLAILALYCLVRVSVGRKR